MSKCVKAPELDLTQTIVDLPVGSLVLFFSNASREWASARVADVREAKELPSNRPDLILVDCGKGRRACLEWASTANVRPLFIDYVFVHRDWRPAVAHDKKQDEYIFLEETDLVSAADFALEDVWTSDPDLRREYASLASDIEDALRCLHKKLNSVVRKAQKAEAELDYSKRETHEYMTEVVIPVLEERGFLTLDTSSATSAFMNSLLQEGGRTLTAARVWAISADYQAAFDRRLKATPGATSKFVFHGTNKAALIIQNGFDLTKAKTGA